MALIVDCITETVHVEEGTFRAAETSSSIPGGTERILCSSKRVGVNDTLTVVEKITVVAREACSTLIPGGTIRRNRDTNPINIEVPALGTLKAHVSVPLGTADVEFSRFTAVVDDIVALITFQTDSLCPVELATKGIDFAAYSLVVEKVAL